MLNRMSADGGTTVATPIYVHGRMLDAVITRSVEVRVTGFKDVGVGTNESEAIKDFENKVAPIMGLPPQTNGRVLTLDVTQRFGKND